MGGKLTRSGYQQLVDENVAWLEAQPRTLEREHIIMIVKWSVGQLYDDPPAIPGDARTRASAAAAAISEDRRPLPPDVLAGTLQDAVVERPGSCSEPHLFVDYDEDGLRGRCRGTVSDPIHRSGTAVGAGTAGEVLPHDCDFEGCDQPKLPGDIFCAGHREQEDREARAPSLEVAPPPGPPLCGHRCDKTSCEDMCEKPPGHDGYHSCTWTPPATPPQGEPR